jgi:VIT1/CCC1 family predicted Fe2+/Mn2+ transporter
MRGCHTHPSHLFEPRHAVLQTRHPERRGDHARPSHGSPRAGRARAPEVPPASASALARRWREEMESAHLYRVIAGGETDEGRRALFTRLGVAAEEQAGIWAGELTRRGLTPPAAFRPSPRARLVAALVRRLGVRPLRGVLAAMKVRGLSVYARPSPLGHAMPTSAADVGRRHRGVATGGNLRAAVFGVNDGLVSNASLILGVAGASDDTAVIVLSGVAGLLAGAFSMAAGEYVSVRSQRELFEYQIGIERAELERYPEEETEEMAIIYHARGVPLEQAREMACRVMADPEKALDTLAREELGLNPEDLGSPAGAALSSFVAFAAGALIPLAPFLLGAGPRALGLSVAAAALGLFGAGAMLSLFTGRAAWWSGTRMVAIGGAAGLATHLIGRLLGVTLA